MLQSACLWRLQTLADAAAQLSADVQQRHPEVDWRGVRGFRNIVVHGYVNDLDLTLTWAYIESDVDQLVRVATVELEKLPRV